MPFTRRTALRHISAALVFGALSTRAAWAEDEVPLVSNEEATPTQPGGVGTDVRAPEEPAFRPVVRPLKNTADLPGTLLLSSSRERPGIGDTTDRYRLFTLQGGALTRISYPDEELGPSAAVLSQDGKQALVVAGSRAIYLLDLKGGTGPRPVLQRLEAISPSQSDSYMGVAWSLDETRVMVARPKPFGMTVVSVADGASVLTPYLGFQPSFAPDGKQFAFSYLAPGEPAAAIYVAPTDGLDAPRKLTPTQAYETWPAWLGDGQRIAYLSRGDTWEVHVWNLRTQAEQVVARSPSTDTAIVGFVFSQDGEWVACSLLEARTQQRSVRVVSVLDTSVWLDLPREGAWNDRALSWADGSAAARA
ncbi:MAG: PD40 domain-containing protein [Chloroflexi bacterium]|nr:PD40 domain-containing protein [Chloroflexota bacterium]